MINIGDYVIVRTHSAGVFIGTLSARDGQEVTLSDARMIWFWAGAATLSQLAVDGTQKPNECKFPVPVPEILLLQAIAILPVSEQARKTIESVPVWKF